MKTANILQLIGNTPHLHIKRLFPELNVWLKLERFNPGGSIKDRIALAMIEDAEKNGELTSEMTIVEPTSGNTGIGLALCAAIKGYEIILVMPESMSPERRKLMTAYGAKIVLTPAKEGMKGSIERAMEIQKDQHAWMPMQFENPSNPEIHIKTTVQEIIKDFPEGFDYFITGVGTGGHITGIGQVLKEHWPATKVIAVEPETSAVLSGHQAGPHKIQGIGAGFIPKVLNTEIIDDVIQISNDKAYEYAGKLAKHEGVLAGISTGASIAAIAFFQEKLKGKTVLSMNYDTGERYLSIDEMFRSDP